MSKKTAKPAAAIVAANNTVTAFETAAVLACLTTLGGTVDGIKASQTARGAASLELMSHAHAFDVFNRGEGVDHGTVIQGWAAHCAAIKLPLSVAGSSLVKLGEAKEGKPAKITWTGYGRNVMSNAAGIIQFNLDPEDLPELESQANSETAKPAPSYNQCAKVVAAKREEADRLANPSKYVVADALAALDADWSELRDIVKSDDDVESIKALQELVAAARETITATMQEQAELAAKAAKAA